MKDLFILVAHLLSTIAKLLGPGGARTIIADSLLMKQQLLVINRHRKRAPRLTPLDRFLLEFWSLFLIQRRFQQAAVIIGPSTMRLVSLSIKMLSDGYWQPTYPPDPGGGPSWLTFLGTQTTAFGASTCFAVNPWTVAGVCQH